MKDHWLTDVVVVNESADVAVAGDISVFRSAGEACAWLEPWWVENKEGFAFTAAGDRLTLGVNDERRVVVRDQQGMPNGATIVQGWLRASAAAVLEARKVKAKTGRAVLGPFEEAGQLPGSIEGLVAYIGFNG